MATSPKKRPARLLHDPPSPESRNQELASRRDFGWHDRHIATIPSWRSQTPEETSLGAEIRSMHNGPLSPASASYRCRAFNEKELRYKDLWLANLQEENLMLNRIVDEAEYMNAQGNLDAFAHAIEQHNSHRSESDMSLLQWMQNVKKSQRKKAARAPRGLTLSEKATSPSVRWQMDNSSDSSFRNPSLSMSMSSWGSEVSDSNESKVPILRFQSAIPGMKAAKIKAAKMKDEKQRTREPPRTVEGKINYATLHTEQLLLDRRRERGEVRYQNIMEQYEISQQNSHKILELLTSVELGADQEAVSVGTSDLSDNDGDEADETFLGLLPE
eukprot:NODE_907_length_1240_cov_228.846348_g692_i0.p1 GENE.NODE_907_length_1240_cov_228.846348_g692_i0~~NODE_907_length_1240_cov_228.846348_g692_i0.p1  ORF type:complete len:329 (+),score=72.29 NODE_907_length_1240_cov_228.846348_g692_i0:138-1124(+)